MPMYTFMYLRASVGNFFHIPDTKKTLDRRGPWWKKNSRQVILSFNFQVCYDSTIINLRNLFMLVTYFFSKSLFIVLLALFFSLREKKCTLFSPCVEEMVSDEP